MGAGMSRMGAGMSRTAIGVDRREVGMSIDRTGLAKPGPSLEAARVRAGERLGAHGGLEIVVRDGKGRRDRVTMLPEGMVEPLRAHLVQV
jgi:hypothetical protein